MRNLRVLICMISLLFFSTSMTWAQDTTSQDLQHVSVSTEAEKIERLFNMDVEINVSQDALLTVTERIVFNARGNQIKRGLIRNVPLINVGANEHTVASFNMISAKLDGRAVPYALQQAGTNIEIHLGDDSFLAYGQHEYIISYSMTNQLIFHDDADELYWNVTGNGWIFPIDTATFKVILPEGATIREYNAYTGPYGSKGNNWKRTSDNTFATTQGLGVREGLTVSVTWDKGFVAAPQKSSFALLWPKIPFILSVLLLITGYVTIWFYWGRDPKKGSVFPEYSPPFGLEAGYIGYAKTLQFGTVNLLADLIQLATQGQIIINPSKDYIEIEKHAQEWTPEISQPHRRLMVALFPKSKTTVRIGKAWDFSVVSAPALIKRMPQFYNLSHADVPFSYARPTLVKWNLLLRLACLVLFVPLGLTIKFMDTPLISELRTAKFWVITMAIPAILLLFYFMVFRTHLKSNKITAAHLAQVIALAAIYLTLSFIYLTLSFYQEIGILINNLNVLKFYYTSDAVLLLGMWISLSTAFFFNCLMPKRTKAGRMLLDRVEGFEMYLNTAEKHRLEMLYPTFKDAAPDMSLEIFERFLPYALTLGVIDAWTEAYWPLMEAQHYHPRWYRGWQGPFSFKTDSLSVVVDTISPPRKSGRSGRGFGGFSGGGMGGGGGRGR